MIAVKATREGLVGGKTASGYVVDTVVPFVALPAAEALHLFIRVRNPANGLEMRAIVLDVGPWNEHDVAYVFQPGTVAGAADVGMRGRRPAAEKGTDSRGRTTNKAGIDLGERVWKGLEMTDNDTVLWEFV